MLDLENVVFLSEVLDSKNVGFNLKFLLSSVGFRRYCSLSQVLDSEKCCFLSQVLVLGSNLSQVLD